MRGGAIGPDQGLLALGPFIVQRIGAAVGTIGDGRSVDAIR